VGEALVTVWSKVARGNDNDASQGRLGEELVMTVETATLDAIIAE
jgi:hypothetical protein